VIVKLFNENRNRINAYVRIGSEHLNLKSHQ